MHYDSYCIKKWVFVDLQNPAIKNISEEKFFGVTVLFICSFDSFTDSHFFTFE